MNDEKVRQICTDVLALAGHVRFLQELVDKLPKTADGVPFLVGMTVYCPRGHSHVVHPSDPIGGRVYCTTGKCWTDGCQSDSGDGTRYSAAECFSNPPTTLPWSSYCEIFPQAKEKIWVRFTGADGIYRWLHPVENRWVVGPRVSRSVRAHGSFPPS